MTDDDRAESSRSLFELIKDLPSLLVALVKAELDQLKQELAEKARYSGVGIGLFAFAAGLIFFALGCLIAAAILGLALVLPGWASALIVFGALLVIAALLALIGVQSLKRMGGAAPAKTIASVQEDIEAIKGMGRYDD
ncbi:phage holin family protein [Diaminobutyricibacter sp. McL0618]|uniref:phage holin family protein n=1 Tax=Leifsonia sp. McL0618 TaxID=3415677 RepID=UPI003CF9851B